MWNWYDKDNARLLPPIRFAGLLAEGGILSFDGNTMTGGAGANLLASEPMSAIGGTS